MVNMIGYALFLNPKELQRTIGKKEVKRARLEGFKRVFNLQPSRWQIYPSAVNEYKAIANAVQEDKAHMNCVVFETTDDEFEMLKIRSKSYNTRKVKIVLHDTGETIEANLLVGKKMLHGEEIINDEFLPIPEYLEKAMNAAKALGDDFYDEWLKTTYTGKGMRFDKYIETL